MIKDGLTDAFHQYHMGITAENVAKKYSLSREEEDSMIKDGLTDAFHQYHMGITAENVANKYSLSREEQDSFAATSQQKAGKAIAEGFFKDEIVPVSVPGRKGETIVSEDEFPKPDTTVESL